MTGLCSTKSPSSLCRPGPVRWSERNASLWRCRSLRLYVVREFRPHQVENLSAGDVRGSTDVQEDGRPHEIEHVRAIPSSIAAATSMGPGQVCCLRDAVGCSWFSLAPNERLDLVVLRSPGIPPSMRRPAGGAGNYEIQINGERHEPDGMDAFGHCVVADRTPGGSDLDRRRQPCA